MERFKNLEGPRSSSFRFDGKSVLARLKLQDPYRFQNILEGIINSLASLLLALLQRSQMSTMPLHGGDVRREFWANFHRKKTA